MTKGTIALAIGGVVVTIILGVVLFGRLGPSNWLIANSETSTTGAEAPTECGSSDTIDNVKQAVGQPDASGSATQRLLDMGHEKELWYDAGNNIRYCNADAVLDSGQIKISYKLYFGPSGAALVEVQQGEDAYGALEARPPHEALAISDYIDRGASLQASAGSSTIEGNPGGDAIGGDVLADGPYSTVQGDHAGRGDCKVPSIEKGMEYGNARTIILRAGFQSLLPPSLGQYCSNSANSSGCSGEREIENCNAEGYCRLNYIDSDGHQLSVVSYGNPAYTMQEVNGWQIRC